MPKVELPIYGIGFMVDVAQSGERWFVEPKVVGSKPTIHPKNFTKNLEK